MNQIRWGVLSTSNFAVTKVIPAIQQSEICQVAAISSRSPEQAEKTAQQLGIPQFYGSYNELIAAPDIDVIYNPLPNHLHVLWTIQALRAGKHVLCEKPISSDADEAIKLLEETRKYPQLKVMEAFMYRFHPQWRWTKEAVEQGKIGKLKTIHSFFSYHNTDPANIRNQASSAGGGLLDIGCYSISLSRFLFGSEPERIMGSLELDAQYKTDRLATGILDFGSGVSTFTCSTQLPLYQRAVIHGDQGRIELEMPFNPLPDQPSRLWFTHEGKTEEITFEACNQYTIQADLFSLAILEDRLVPTSLEDAVANMISIDTLKQSAKSGRWERP